MSKLTQFTLTFAQNIGDKIDIWGHSPGVTTEDYENDPSIDPYYYHQSYTATETSGSSVVFTYDAERGYVASIYINGVLAANRTIDPVVTPDIPDPSISGVIVGYTSITFNFINVETTDSVSVSVVIGGVSHIGTLSRYSENRASVYFGGLTSGTMYSFKVTINGSTTSVSYFTDSYPVFQWDTTITAGAPMKVEGTEVSPITADEWNRFIDLYNLKKGQLYTHVSKGDEFSVKSGSTPKAIADSLGVNVSVGNTITAQFFIDLKNALNALR